MSIAGREPAAEDEGAPERLRAQVRDLRARPVCTHRSPRRGACCGTAHALPDAESAFALLQRASQRYDVKVRTLAGALVSVPRPDHREPLWFPRRVRRPERALTFAAAHRS
ncbi:hypothetical protein [Streptomyces sp. NPDC058735]|uniref:hypothetical protein n=1 Tax=unclassified Streptomyces TaxID=2593676 RepID=UPI0036C3C422